MPLKWYFWRSMDVSGRQNVGNEIIRQGVGIVGRTEKNRGKLVEMV
jgi:hypothetical protein